MEREKIAEGRTERAGSGQPAIILKKEDSGHQKKKQALVWPAIEQNVVVEGMKP
jgi:hypothetical protein